MLEPIPRSWNEYNPYEKRNFYDLQIKLLSADKKKYKPESQERKDIERKRIKMLCGLSEVIDEIRYFEDSERLRT